MGREGYFEGPSVHELPKPEAEASVESGEITPEALDQVEQEVSAIADQEIGGNDEITRRLLALGGTRTEIGQVLEQTAAVDQEIEGARDSAFSQAFDALDTFYREKVEHLDRSIVAELKIRPAHQKCKSLEDVARQRGVQFNPGSYDERLIKLVTALSQMPDAVDQHQLSRTVVTDTRNYKQYFPDRRFERVLRMGEVYGRVQEEAVDMRVLHAVLLHKIKSETQDPQKLQELIDVYFEPSPFQYVSSKAQQVHSEKLSDISNSYPLVSALDRIQAFNQHIMQDRRTALAIPKPLLQAKAIDFLEDERNIKDIFRRYPEWLAHLHHFIENCEFSEDQKGHIYSRMFTEMRSHPDALYFFLKNPDLPYTDEQKRQVVDLVSTDDDVRKVTENPFFHFSTEQRGYLQGKIYALLQEKIRTSATEGRWKLNESFNDKSLEESDLLTREQIDSLHEMGHSLTATAVQNYIHGYLGQDRFKPTAAIDVMDTTRLVPDQYKEGVEKALEGIPWKSAIEKMLAAYKRSRRSEYDPWVQDLDPLIRGALNDGFLHLENEQDGNLLLEYVKKVGPRNLPRYFRLFSEIKRCGSAADLKPETRARIKDDFGVDVNEVTKGDPENLGSVINAMEKFRIGFSHRIMDDDPTLVDIVLRSEICQELLASIKGRSGHSQGGTDAEALGAYKKALEKNPEAFELPDGYETTQITVREYGQTQDVNEEQSAEQVQQILANPDLVNYHGRIVATLETFRENTPLTDHLDYYKSRFIEDFQAETASLDQKIADEEQKADPNTKAIENLKKASSTLREQRQQFIDFDFSAVGDNSVQIMEAFQKLIPDRLPTKQSVMLELSVRDMSKKFPEQFDRLLNRTLVSDLPTVSSVDVFAEFVRSHVGEHYLDKKHGEDQAITTQDKNLIKYLKKVWSTQNFDDGVISIAQRKLEALEKGELSLKKRSISLVPSKGMQRIFSGDLGAACTSRRNLELAKGEYPDIVSYSLVLDKDGPAEKFSGSFLVVETTASDDQKILIIRANNPAQNLAFAVDSSELIKKIIDEVKRVAERRGISKVGIVMNQGAASNRPFVTDYYREHFPLSNAVQLKKTKETTFNGYDISNKDGPNPTVVV